MPGRSLSACVILLFERPCWRCPATPPSGSGSWSPTGEEIPYDVDESGDGSPIPQYIPLTERFVRDHASELRELDSFGAACAAIEAAGLAGPYLSDNGVEVAARGAAPRASSPAWSSSPGSGWTPPTSRSTTSACGRRSPRSRPTATPASARSRSSCRCAACGWRRPALTWRPATIVRADTVDVPAEARASEASGGAGLGAHLPRRRDRGRARARRGRARRLGHSLGRGLPPDDHRAAAVQARRRRPGPARLDARRRRPLAADLDRRGQARARAGIAWPRPSSAELAGFSRAVQARMTDEARALRASGGVERAIARFEAGLERTAAIDALNDYLLALRFVLEGGGPADLGLAMRVASLCAEPDNRTEVKSVIDRALALERELWSGEPPAGDSEDMSPGRDRPRGRGAGARDPQGRRLRPPGRRPARHRRRDPARRRPRRRRRRRGAARRDRRVGRRGRGRGDRGRASGRAAGRPRRGPRQPRRGVRSRSRAAV